MADTAGNFDWSMPDADVHQVVNDLMRTVGTHLYGRRLYDVMIAWETLAVGTTRIATAGQEHMLPATDGNAARRGRGVEREGDHLRRVVTRE